MTAVTNVEFVAGTVVSSAWLNGINDYVNALPTSFTTGELQVNGSILMPNTVGDADQKLTIYSSPKGPQIMADYQQLMYGVTEFSDNGAVRFVSSHLGTSYGFPASTANVAMRASEHHAIRGVGTVGSTWGMEVGVSSEVAGDTFLTNVGIYIASSASGFLTGTPVRNDAGIVVGGADGWHHGFLYYDTNSSTILYDVTSTGQVKARGGLSVNAEAGTLGYATGVSAGGTVSQNTDKTTEVFIDKPTGEIITSPAALGAGAIASIVVHNAYISATDNVIVNITQADVASTAAYNVWAVPGSGAMIVHLKNITAGSLSESVHINFTRINGSKT